MVWLRIPRLLAGLGALMYGGKTVLGIQLDLSDTSKNFPISRVQKLQWHACALRFQLADLAISSCRLHKTGSKHGSIWHDDLLHRKSDRATCRIITKPVLLVGGRGYVWTDD